MIPGADIWELARDYDLATPDVRPGIMAKIQNYRARCQHIPNPEHPERCYKCGADTVAGPGVIKARRKPLELKRQA